MGPRQSGDAVRDVVVIGGLALSLLLVFAPTVYLSAADWKRSEAEAATAAIAEGMTSFYVDLGRWPTEGNGELRSDELACLGTRDGKWPASAADGYGWVDRAPRDEFDNHLLRNRPRGIRSLAYADGGERFSWSGPYVDDLSADPWGRKYVSNVFQGHRSRRGPLWVISAGPNGVIETRSTAHVVAGDDIGTLVRH